ncbi:uncharacterized protein LOC134653262 [Cydia amplana]|uniref:uncharacterized protein LOC134653262 n=1 Tax=Cydia amplana TaxID=1869771 RepID=UPI002FE5614C
MRLEIPTFTRCCCCFPLRRGIIILGYLSLVFAVFVIWLETQMTQNWSDVTMTLFRGASFSVQKWLPIFLYCIEIVFVLILLAGAHTRRPNLIRVYYYYGITTTAAALAVYIMLTMPRRIQPFYSYYVIEICIMFAGLVTQVYLLLLIRSELRKPRGAHRINHLAEV